jgi:hypothetical protein
VGILVWFGFLQVEPCGCWNFQKMKFAPVKVTVVVAAVTLHHYSFQICLTFFSIAS